MAKQDKALVITQATLHDDIFVKILILKMTKEAWDHLKEEFQGSERTKRMQGLTLRREFKAVKMNEIESVKDFIDILLKVVTKINLFGEKLNNEQVFQGTISEYI